jgi:hypothetical protein
MLYTGKFLLLSTSRVPFLIILKAKYSIRLRFLSEYDVAVLSKIILNNRLTPLFYLPKILRYWNQIL